MAFSLIAHTATGSAGTTSGINTTGANLIVVTVAYDTQSGVSDSNGNTWTALTAQSGSQDGNARMYYCFNPTVGAGHTFTSAQGYGAICVSAWSGAATSPQDQQNGQYNGPSPTSTIEPDRITVVPNGVDSTFRVLPQNEVASFRQKHGILADTLCLLNVGLNHPRKNVLTILKLLKELRDKILPIHFWKAGADFTVEQKKFIETHRLENCITYLGQPDQHTLLQIYNAADVLLSPSFYEGFGITILEAMACGTVVITSNVTSLPEVAGDAAILVEPNDIHAMLQAVYRIVEDKCYRESLVKRGLVRAKLFTWERSAEQIAEIYEKMVLKHENQGFIEKPQNL